MKMTTTTAAQVQARGLTRETLEETPPRAFKLLHGIGISLPIRAMMAGKGYSEDDHQDGWNLLGTTSGYRRSGGDDRLLGFDSDVRAPIQTLDGWDEDGFRIVRAALGREFPEQAAAVLDGIGPSRGPAAVLGVETLLNRLDELEKSKDKQDRAALAKLAKRSIDETERKRLRALVQVAKRAPEIVPVDTRSRDIADAKHLAALTELRGWYDEWSEIARSAVKRRDYLILLGLAKRKASAPGAPGADPSSPAEPTT